MITLIMYVIGALLLSIGEAIALSRNTDRELPITAYIRGLLKLGPIGFLLLLVVWIWLGYHFLIDRTGSLPF